jgi:hypothetical protein
MCSELRLIARLVLVQILFLHVQHCHHPPRNGLYAQNRGTQRSLVRLDRTPQPVPVGGDYRLGR